MSPEEQAQAAEVERMIYALHDASWQQGYEAALAEKGSTSAVDIFEIGRKCGALSKDDAWWDAYVTGIGDAQKPCTRRHSSRRWVRKVSTRPPRFARGLAAAR